MFDELYFADRTNDSRIQHDVYTYLKEDIRIDKFSIIKLYRSLKLVYNDLLIFETPTSTACLIIDYNIKWFIYAPGLVGTMWKFTLVQL
jgi:hypothetical protein